MEDIAEGMLVGAIQLKGHVDAAQLASLQFQSRQGGAGVEDEQFVVAERFNALALLASALPGFQEVILQPEPHQAEIEERSESRAGGVEAEGHFGRLIAQVADDFTGGSESARGDEEEGAEAAVAQRDVAPGDVVVVFDIVPDGGAFGDGDRLDPGQQAKMLGILEAVALVEWRRVEPKNSKSSARSVR